MNVDKKDLVSLLNRWQALAAEGTGDVTDLYNDTIDIISRLDDFIQEEAYHAGFVDALATYAVYRDGKQVVGCLDTPLKKAQSEAKQAHNYFPRIEE